MITLYVCQASKCSPKLEPGRCQCTKKLRPDSPFVTYIDRVPRGYVPTDKSAVERAAKKAHQTYMNHPLDKPNIWDAVASAALDAAGDDA